MYHFLQKWWNMINLLFFSVLFISTGQHVKNAFIAFMLLFMCWIMIYGLMRYFETNRGKRRIKTFPQTRFFMSYTFVVPMYWMMFSNFPGTYKYVIVKRNPVSNMKYWNVTISMLHSIYDACIGAVIAKSCHCSYCAKSANHEKLNTKSLVTIVIVFRQH